ncbi:MAG: hypothetical protein Q9159_003512 [Coniocarpon cinnabarinum]
MSRDSSRTQLHLHASHHAQLFEDFTSTLIHNNNHPSSSCSSAAPLLSPTSGQPTALYTTNLTPGVTASHATSLLTSALPHEDILVPPHLLPPNPEDEDDVVPDQHAAFGIVRAMKGLQVAGGGGEKERWRDFDTLLDLVKGKESERGALLGTRVGGLSHRGLR